MPSTKSGSGKGKDFVRVDSDSGEFAYHLKPTEGMPGIMAEEPIDDLPF